jgi:hypothetical protein
MGRTAAQLRHVGSRCDQQLIIGGGREVRIMLHQAGESD